jgi:MioC protein
MSRTNVQIGIFVATMTGLANVCAEEIEAALTQSGLKSETHLMDGLGPDALSPYDLLIIVSSTYGQGDIPDNGQALFDSLAAGADLSAKQYAVFGLGDRSYFDTFCAAADSWDETLTSCGANRFIDVVRHDASAGSLAEDVAAEWAAEWAPLVGATAG